MRRAWWSALFGGLLLAACDGSRADLEIEEYDGATLKHRWSVSIDGAALFVNATFIGAGGGGNSNTPPSLLVPPLPGRTRISGYDCSGGFCPDAAGFAVTLPLTPLNTGLSSGFGLSLAEGLGEESWVDLSGHGLAFDEPEFVWSGDVFLRQRARLVPPASGPRRATGEIRLAYKCDDQHQYFRFCGSVVRLPTDPPPPFSFEYREDTCPRDLVAPFEVEPVWSGESLRLGDRDVGCKSTEVGRYSDGRRNIVCYRRDTGVRADGCDWNVHFLTDGSRHQFAVVGFGQGACAERRCETYR